MNVQFEANEVVQKVENIIGRHLTFLEKAIVEMVVIANFAQQEVTKEKAQTQIILNKINLK